MYGFFNFRFFSFSAYWTPIGPLLDPYWTPIGPLLGYKLLGGLAVRRACYGVVRFIMENGAKGCEVIISGKLRAQRAKAMKFKDGYLISTGEPKRHYISHACRHVLMRQGVLGVMVKIMLAHDPEGKMGAKMPLPDNVIIHEPKEDIVQMGAPPEDDTPGYAGDA